jgi:hypothetical protein
VKLFASALMRLAMSSPFESCGNAWSNKLKQDQANQPPPPEYCRMDPPLGCGGVCLTGDVAMMIPSDTPPSTTPYCNASYAGALTMLFATDVQTVLVCDTSLDSYVVSAPYFQIVPEVVETGDGCAQPPPIPTSMPLSVFMGIEP